MNLNNIAILNINGANYYCIVNRVGKNEAINYWKALIRQKKWKFIKNSFPLLCKAIVTFVDIEVEKHKFLYPDFRRSDIKKYGYLTWYIQAKKVINILLVTKMTIIKLNHYA